MQRSLRKQYELRERAMRDEDYVVEQLGILAKYVHHNNMTKNITASTPFYVRIAAVKSTITKDELAALTTAYCAVKYWLENHNALIMKIYQKVQNMVPVTQQVETIELINTMAMSIMLNYSNTKCSKLYKYMSCSLWLKSRSMFKNLKAQKDLMVESFDAPSLGHIAQY
jgi:hypothetical protein